MISSLPFGFLTAQKKDSVVTFQGVTVTSTAKVSDVVNKAFKQAYTNAENPRWYKVDKNFLAKFIANDMNHNALFVKNGYLKYDISFGYEYNLPEDIYNQVQSSYNDYRITRTINLKGSDRNFWIVNLEGDKYFYTVSVEEGELHELEKFRKEE